MKYKKVLKSNPRDLGAKKKCYAIPVNKGTLTVAEFANIIATRSSLTRGDVLNVLSNYMDELPFYLKMGKSVQLGDFGTLRLSFSSDGAENPDDFTAYNIIDVRVIFTPSNALKQALKNIHFEEEK